MSDKKPDNQNEQEPEPESLKWFRENYPSESYLVNEIVKHANGIFSKLGSQGQVIPVDIQALPTSDGKLVIGMRDVMVIFIGAMAKALVDIMVKNIQADLAPKVLQQLDENARKAIKEYAEEKFPIISGEFKRCSTCSVENDGFSNYCKNCGKKLG